MLPAERANVDTLCANVNILYHCFSCFAGLVLNIFLAILPLILKLMNKQQVSYMPAHCQSTEQFRLLSDYAVGRN